MTIVAPSVRSLLAAIDESERGKLVFATAAAMAGDLDAQLFVLRVLTMPLDVPPAAHTLLDGVVGKMAENARSELSQLMTGAPPQVRLGPPLIVEGEPWRRILEVSREFDVDLIVVGSHRYHGLDRVLGTVAAKVVNHADRNVLVVHERKRPQDPG
jgi:nucleotide-binding universal stress UspA family protein